MQSAGCSWCWNSKRRLQRRGMQSCWPLWPQSGQHLLRLKTNAAVSNNDFRYFCAGVNLQVKFQKLFYLQLRFKQ